MAINEPELNPNPNLMSAEKRAWWAQEWSGHLPKQSRLAVFQYAMNSTIRPTAPDETISFGYLNMDKFHDFEPALILSVIEQQDLSFFDTYPRKRHVFKDEEWIKFKCAIIGEAAKAFYRHGLASYVKPNLRKSKHSSYGIPLAAL